MRAIVLGAGASGLLHALSFRAHGVEIEAVFDPDLARARSLAELVGGRAVPSLNALDASDADVVAICGPPPVHVAQAVRFARAERILLVEKPIALDEAELSKLEALDRCVPVLQWRFGRAIRAVRSAVRRGEFGSRPSVAIDLAWHRDEAYFASGRGQRKSWGCGALLSIGIHAVDAVLFALGGEVVSAVGSLERRADLDVEIGAALILTTDTGAHVTLRMTLDAADDRTRIAFCGAGVTAIISGTEEDPTASELAWSATNEDKLARLRALGQRELGFTSGPLLVPFVGAAISSGRVGQLGVPTVRAVAAAHRAIYSVYACSRPAESSARRYR